LTELITRVNERTGQVWFNIRPKRGATKGEVERCRTLQVIMVTAINAAQKKRSDKIVASGVDVQKDGIAVHVEEREVEEMPAQAEAGEGKA
jgi:hypothetical protein